MPDVPEVAEEAVVDDNEEKLAKKCLRSTSLQIVLDAVLVKDGVPAEAGALRLPSVDPSHSGQISEDNSAITDIDEGIQIVSKGNSKALQNMMKTTLGGDDLLVEQDLESEVVIADAEDGAPAEDGYSKEPVVESYHRADISEDAPPSMVASHEHLIDNVDNDGVEDVDVSDEELEENAVEAEELDTDGDIEEEEDDEVVPVEKAEVGEPAEYSDDESYASDESNDEEGGEYSDRSRDKSSTVMTSSTVENSSERSSSTFHEVPKGRLEESDQDDEIDYPVVALIKDVEEDSA